MRAVEPEVIAKAVLKGLQKRSPRIFSPKNGVSYGLCKVRLLVWEMYN